MLAPILTPHGALTLRQTADAPELTPELGAQLNQAFARGSGYGLLWLGANGFGATMPPMLSYWRDFGARYVTALCALPSIDAERTKPSVLPLCLLAGAFEAVVNVCADDLQIPPADREGLRRGLSELALFFRL